MALETRGGTGRRCVGAAAVLVAVAVLAAGCSGSAARAGISAATTTTTAAAGSAPAGGATATTAAGGTSTTVAGADGGSPGSPFCQASNALKKRQAAEEKTLLNTPASVEKAENQAVADLPEFQRLAPSSLASAVSVLVAEDRLIFSQLQAVNFDYAQLPPSVNKSLQSPQFTQAEDQITNYLTHVCGISPTS